jgi:16S rRNA (cytidine1402-2'-O)-methyltransferase
LGDLSARAIATLRGAGRILAEDKRVSAKLLAHAGATAPMTAYHDHSDEGLRDRILAELGTKAIALISDAGTPLISDPGYKLVRAARAAGHAVHTVPGPCAAVAALTLAGLPTDRFLFLGFLPAKAKARADTIAEVAAVRASLILYESGPRLGESLAALAKGLGTRDAAVVREISKLHEETVPGTLAELAARYADAPPRGEIVIVVGPPAERAEASDDDLDRALDEALARLSPSRAAAEVAAALGIPRKRAYARALERAAG